jgi:PBP1b-binding outer membrane lipoprotein LpoB
MRKLHIIIVCLLILAVLLSGCVGEKAAQQPSQTTIPQGEGLQGNISVPGDNDLLIEEPLSSADENVDMGSLI